MNKLFFHATLLCSLMLAHTSTHAESRVVFPKLMPVITKDANSWTETVSKTLESEQQLAYANFLALLSSGQYTPALIKCAEYIESCADMSPSSQQLGLNTMQELKKFADEAEEKITRKKNLTETEEESLWQKLEVKIQELLAYINAIYYKVLYGEIAKKNPSSLFYMFDDNGIIPQEKRTKPLPRP